MKELEEREGIHASVDALTFPPKKMWGNTKPEVMEERRQGLQEWISGIVDLPALAKYDKFATFMGIP